MHLRRTHAAAQRGRLKQRQHDFQGKPIASSLAIRQVWLAPCTHAASRRRCLKQLRNDFRR
eukprot:3315998-Alexandrium_andersonii.AAC.1